MCDIAEILVNISLIILDGPLNLGRQSFIRAVSLTDMGNCVPFQKRFFAEKCCNVMREDARNA